MVIGSLSQGADVDSAALALLKAKGHLVNGLLNGNAMVLEHSQTCIEQLACEERQDKQCAPVHPFEIKKKFLNGKIDSAHVDCAALMEHYYGIQVAPDLHPEFNRHTLKDFSKSRIYLALSQPRARDNNSLLEIQWEKYPELVYNANPEALIPQWSTGFRLPYVRPTPLSDKEVLTLERYFEEHVDLWTETFVAKNWQNLKYSELDLDYQEGTDEVPWKGTVGILDRSCNANLSDWLQGTDSHTSNGETSCQFHDGSPLLQAMTHQYAKFLRWKLADFRKKAQNAYYTLSTGNPIFFQISGPHFSWDEVSQAIHNMSLAADRGSLTPIDLDTDDWTDLKAVYKFETQFPESHSLVVRAMIDFDDEILTQASKSIHKYFHKSSLIDIGVGVAGLVSTLALCISSKRILKFFPYSARILAKAGCFSMIGLPLTIFFLADGIEDRIQTWSRSLGSAEFGLILNDIDRLNDHDLQILMSAIFLPVIFKIDNRILSAVTNKKILKRVIQSTNKRMKIEE